MWHHERENARPGLGAIKTQSRESGDPERGRLVKIGFLDTDKVNGMKQKKVKLLSATGSKTSSITLKNPEGVRGGTKAGSVERQSGTKGGGEGVEGKDTKQEEMDRRFEDEGLAEVKH